MGCDKPAKRPHRITIGDTEEFITTCPRKLMADAVPYLKAHRWAAAGNLEFLYPNGQLPAKVAEAIEVLDSEQARRQKAEYGG